jgi:putative transposase
VTEGHFSCVKAAKTLGMVSHDRLNRELKKEFAYQVHRIDWENLPPGGNLMTDTSTVAKPHSQQIEGVRYVYDSSLEEVILGLEVFLVLYVVEGTIYLVDVMMPQKGGANCNELFREVLKGLKEAGLQPKLVLFDNWFASKENLNLLHRFKWIYVARVKCNRLFDGQQVRLHRFYGAKGKCGKLKGVYGWVQIVKDGDRYLITNQLTPHTSRSLAKLYGKRWTIETVFRDMKYVLHLKECASRSLQNQFHHLLAVLDAYFFLRSHYPGMGLESARSQFLQEHRTIQWLPHFNQLIAA